MSLLAQIAIFLAAAVIAIPIFRFFKLGSVLGYWIGAKGGRPMVERYGKWVLLSNHDLDRMTGFFEKYGSITILLGRMLPIVQTFVAFPIKLIGKSKDYLLFHRIASDLHCFAHGQTIFLTFSGSLR